MVAGFFSSCLANAQQQLDLDSVIDEIDQLISSESFDKAKQKLTDTLSLGIRDERLDMLSGRLKLFSSMNHQSDHVPEDQTIATDLFDSLKVALENGDFSQITEFTDPSQSTSALLQALFTNYAAVEVKLSDTTTDTAQQNFFATLEFVQLTTANGDIAYPADAWKAHELRVTKSPGDWRKVRW